MALEDQIRDEKLQYDTKISALSSGKFNKYKYLTSEEKFPSNQNQIIEQAKFTYSPLRKAFEKQIKTMKIKRKNKSKQFKIKEKLKKDKKNMLIMINIVH